MPNAETSKIKQMSEENTMKKIARRFEAAKVAVLEARGVTESVRFDPKLKVRRRGGERGKREREKGGGCKTRDLTYHFLPLHALVQAKGLLDLYMDKQPDAGVPDAAPKKPAAGGGEPK